MAAHTAGLFRSVRGPKGGVEYEEQSSTGELTYMLVRDFSFFLETLVSQVLSDYPPNAGFANGLFVMTTATDHKNNLNSSALKKNYVRTLRVETIASSAGGTAEVAIVAQPSTGFLNGGFYPDGSLRKTPKTA